MQRFKSPDKASSSCRSKKAAPLLSSLLAQHSGNGTTAHTFRKPPMECLPSLSCTRTLSLGTSPL